MVHNHLKYDVSCRVCSILRQMDKDLKKKEGIRPGNETVRFCELCNALGIYQRRLLKGKLSKMHVSTYNQGFDHGVMQAVLYLTLRGKGVR